MTAEVLSRWDPSWLYRDVPDTTILDVLDNIEGFRVLLSASKCPESKLHVPRGSLVLYRVYDEMGLVGRSLSGLEKGHCFYKLEHSPLIAEAESMFGSGRSAHQLLHYAIYTADRCVDIISTIAPIFKSLRDPDV
jgi:hypothetical protein